MVRTVGVGERPIAEPGQAGAEADAAMAPTVLREGRRQLGIDDDAQKAAIGDHGNSGSDKNAGRISRCSRQFLPEFATWPEIGG